MTNILDTLKEHITPELLSDAAKTHGETELGISKALGSLAPALLAGILEKSGDSHSIDGVFAALRNFDPTILNALPRVSEPAHATAQQAASRLVNLVFGAKTQAITHGVAAFSGVKPATATALLGTAAPMVMGVLSQKIKDENLKPSALVRYLLQQKPHFTAVLPMNVASMLGFANTGLAQRQVYSMFGKGPLWLILLMVVLGVALAFYLKG